MSVAADEILAFCPKNLALSWMEVISVFRAIEFRMLHQNARLFGQKGIVKAVIVGNESRA
jgi:hypothetical protein